MAGHTPIKWRLDFNRDNAERLPVRESSNHCPDFEPLLIYGLQLTCHCSTTLGLWRICGVNSDLYELMPSRISRALLGADGSNWLGNDRFRGKLNNVSP